MRYTANGWGKVISTGMPMKTPSFTAEMAAKAKTLVLTMGMKQHHAAAILGVNQGRVNEALHNPKWANVEPAPVSEVLR